MVIEGTARPGTGWIVEVKRTPEEEQKHTPSPEDLGKETKTECLGLLERCVKVGEVPTASNVH